MKRVSRAGARQMDIRHGWPLLRAVRPRQWTKNLLVYAAFFFTLNDRWNLEYLDQAGLLLLDVTIAFVSFCALSASTYLLNDVMDAKRDRIHPKKRYRPVASGSLGIPPAIGSAVVLATFGIGIAFSINNTFGITAMMYFAFQGIYTAALKHVAIIDVIALSMGFLIRAAAGAIVIDAPISPWLYVCTVLGALFIGFGKRRNELTTVGSPNKATRISLAGYSLPLLDQLIAISATATLIAYTIYTFTAESLPANGLMMLTIPFVCYGIFRYLYLLHSCNLGENPEEILLDDKPLLATIILWGACVGLILLFARS